MAPRIFLVPAHSQLLEAEGTVKLHIYANGEVLIRTEEEFDPDGLTEIKPGLQQSGVAPEIIDSLRDRIIAPEAGRRDRQLLNAYIELIGPTDPSWLERLQALGLELLQYQPNYTYLSRGSVEALQEAGQLPFVLHVTPVTEAIKPRQRLPEAGEKLVWLVVQGEMEMIPQIIAALNKLPEVTIDPQEEIEPVGFYLRLKAKISALGQDLLLQQPQVLAVEAYVPRLLEDEVANLILAGQYNALGQPSGSYLRWLEDRGINGAGVTIGIVDAGVDTTHPALQGRSRDFTGGSKSWHGTFVAGHAAGCYLQERDENQFIYGLGVAPAAQILAQDNQRSSSALCRETVANFGTVQNNSWGAGTQRVMTYGSLEAVYDHLVRNADPQSHAAKPLTICFSAGNSGIAGLTRPKAAKNVIVTGNSENYRPRVGKDESDNIEEIYSGPHASSHGNCGDGRIRPHITIAGEWTASANYDSYAGDREYISPQLTWGGGTSAASPKTAGACALLIQWWRQHNHGSDPSPALLRALLVNGAVPMQSAGSIPNPIQGWGRLNLENILAQDRRCIYVDQSVILKQRGEQRQWQIRVDQLHQPLKITLAWTDPPGAIGSGTATMPAIINKLALRVETNGKLYRGNQFINGWSVANGSAAGEGWDNLQNVYLPEGAVQGTVTVSVVALEITTNCFTNQISNPQQDFALVISNASLDAATNSTEVFVGLDQAAPGTEKPGEEEDFWADDDSTQDNSTSQWWNDIDSQTGSTTPSPAGDLDAWWLAGEKVRVEAETNRRQPTLAENKTLLQALQTGMQGVVKSAHRLALGTRSRLETSRLKRITQATEPEQAYIDILEALNSSLSQVLAHLMARWQDFTARKQRQASVLLVGNGTRVTAADIATMGRLSFWGDLYLVSPSAPILTFLAQQLQRQVGIHFRLAPDSASLPLVVQDTLMAACGAHRLVVSPQGTARGFQVVSGDRSLLIQVQLPPQQPAELQLLRPGLPPQIITTQPGGMAQIELKAAQGEPFWAGAWTIQLPPEVAAQSLVQVWAWSDLQFTLTEKKSAAQSLITLRGTGGTRFSQLQVKPRSLSAKSVTEEGGRSRDKVLEVQIEASRLDYQHHRTSLYAPTISAWMPSTSTVVDLTLQVTGIDAQGYPFSRVLHHNLLQLQPRSQQRLHKSALPVLLVEAKIAKVHYAKGVVTALTLQQGTKQRRVRVSSPLLRQQLVKVKLSQSSEIFCFRVRGEEAIAVIRVLSPHLDLSRFYQQVLDTN